MTGAGVGATAGASMAAGCGGGDDMQARRRLAPGGRGHPGEGLARGEGRGGATQLAEQSFGSVVGPHDRLEVELARTIDEGRGSADLARLQGDDAVEQLAALAATVGERLAHVLGEGQRLDDIVHRRIHHRVDDREQPEREQLARAPR